MDCTGIVFSNFSLFVMQMYCNSVWFVSTSFAQKCNVCIKVTGTWSKKDTNNFRLGMPLVVHINYCGSLIRKMRVCGLASSGEPFNVKYNLNKEVNWSHVIGAIFPWHYEMQ